MNARTVDAIFASFALVLATAAIEVLRRPLPYRSIVPLAISATPVVTANRDTASLDAAAQQVIESDPFRLSRLPSSAPFQRSRSTGVTTVTAAPRPTLIVKGIMGGPPWLALLDGIPGAPPGTLVKTGSTFDKLVVLHITRDSVIVRGSDTTWRLSIGKSTP